MSPQFPRRRTIVEQVIPSTSPGRFSLRRDRVVPALHLAAKWLACAGFQPGDKVTIDCCKTGELIIKKVSA